MRTQQSLARSAACSAVSDQRRPTLRVVARELGRAKEDRPLTADSRQQADESQLFQDELLRSRGDQVRLSVHPVFAFQDVGVNLELRVPRFTRKNSLRPGLRTGTAVSTFSTWMSATADTRSALGSNGSIGSSATLIRRALSGICSVLSRTILRNEECELREMSGGLGHAAAASRCRCRRRRAGATTLGTTMSTWIR